MKSPSQVKRGFLELFLQMNIWQRLMQQPQRIWLRRALFQIHLWTGLAVGLYVLVISVTGSIVVFRIELYNRFTLKPITVTGQGAILTDEQVTATAEKAYAGFKVANIFRTKPRQRRGQPEIAG